MSDDSSRASADGIRIVVVEAPAVGKPRRLCVVGIRRDCERAVRDGERIDRRNGGNGQFACSGLDERAVRQRLIAAVHYLRVVSVRVKRRRPAAEHEIVDVLEDSVFPGMLAGHPRTAVF